MEAKDEGLRSLIVQELEYMQALWGMYTDRVCPAAPSWLAPYPYSPATFLDTLFGMYGQWLNEAVWQKWLCVHMYVDAKSQFTGIFLQYQPCHGWLCAAQG